MLGLEKGVENRCRVWIVRYEGEPPTTWEAVPAEAVAVEPAEAAAMTAGRARRYAAAFNRAAVRGPRKIWAVAVPVRVCYHGDPRPGERIAAGVLRFWEIETSVVRIRLAAQSL